MLVLIATFTRPSHRPGLPCRHRSPLSDAEIHHEARKHGRGDHREHVCRLGWLWLVYEFMGKFTGNNGFSINYDNYGVPEILLKGSS